MSTFQHMRNDSAVNTGDDELRLIPVWSMVLAAALFIGFQYFFDALPHGRPGDPHGSSHSNFVAIHYLMGYAWAALLASYALMLGYVSRDVKRRGMSAPLWMLVCLILPGGIGTVVYFMLRQPVLQTCPNCRTSMASTYNFCPQCQFQVAPVCGECHHSVRITDAFCTCCGHELASDGAPARLRVYGD